MNEIRIKEYEELLKGEEELKKELNKPGGLEKGYKKYYLLDNNWVENYKKLIANKKFNQINNLLKVDLIKTKHEKKDFSYIQEDFTFTFPYNFTFVTKNFIDLLCKNFDNIKEQRILKGDSSKIIIGGKCLIMRDQSDESILFAYIILYDEKKKKFNNNIDYFLTFKDKKEFEIHLNYILKYNIWNFFKQINYSYNNEYATFKNSKRKAIGYIALNGSNIKQIEEIYNYIKENINIKMNKNEMNDINRNEMNDMNKIEMNDIKIDKFYSFLLCLYNIKELYDKLMVYYTNGNNKSIIKNLINFILFKNFDDNIKEYFFKSINSNDYKLIINDIFDKINSELNNENINEKNDNQNNQVAQYDEIKAKKNFLEKNKNTSIIKQLFFISKEDILFCSGCKMNIYNFYYSNYFLIDLDKEKKEVLLNDKFYASEDIQIKQKCNFCSGKELDCIKNEKIFDYPKILIVLLDGKQFQKFKLKNNIYIFCNNNQDILYYLISFIESDTNIVYFEKSTKWYKYIEKDKKEESRDYDKKSPIVLFYRLTKRELIDELIN